MQLQFRGHTFDLRTKRMLLWAEKNAGFQFTVTQGGYNTGGVAASAGTHDKAAVDLSVRGMHPRTINTILNAMKDAGFAAWYRVKADGFDVDHIHAVPIDGNLSRVALQQQAAYLNGRDGLVSNNHDTSYRPRPQVTFSLPLNRPIVRKKAN